LCTDEIKNSVLDIYGSDAGGEGVREMMMIVVMVRRVLYGKE
jgi:hypothetical protein